MSKSYHNIPCLIVSLSIFEKCRFECRHAKTMLKHFRVTCAFYILLVDFLGQDNRAKIKAEALCAKNFRLFSCWVPDGTRTHDIQNHNLTL